MGVIERLSLLKGIQAGFKLAGKLAILLCHLMGRIDLEHRSAELGSNPNGMKLDSTHDIWPGISWMLGASQHLLYIWGSTSLSYRRSSEGSDCHRDSATLHREWATLLQPETILAVCREIGYTAWRDRLLTPVTTIHLFLLQILHGHTACSHLPHLSGVRFTAAA
jgi:hypothetical protein